MIHQVGFTAEGGFCSCALNDNNKRGTYSWPEAVVGQTASQMCQYGVFGQNVTRYCSKQVWMEDASVCPTVVTQEFSRLSSTVQNVRWSVAHLMYVHTSILVSHLANYKYRQCGECDYTTTSCGITSYRSGGSVCFQLGCCDYCHHSNIQYIFSKRTCV